MEAEVEDLQQISCLRAAVARRRGRPMGRACRGLIPGAGRARVEVVVARGQGRQLEERLDQLEDRAVVVEGWRQVAAPGVGRDHERRHTHARPVGVEPRRWYVVEEATTLVVGEDEGGMTPRR